MTKRQKKHIIIHKTNSNHIKGSTYENLGEYMPSAWTINNDASCFSRSAAKSFQKNYPQEFVNIMANLDRYKSALDSGIHPEQIKKENTFVHNEGKGVVSITQHPLRKGTHPLRLYVYPCLTTHVLHILFIGDKHHQEKDIQTIHNYVKKNLQEPNA